MSLGPVFDSDGQPTLSGFDFDTACRNRELRNAVWEIYDLVWDWETITNRTALQLDALAEQLGEHLARRSGKGGP